MFYLTFCPREFPPTYVNYQIPGLLPIHLTMNSFIPSRYFLFFFSQVVSLLSFHRSDVLSIFNQFVYKVSSYCHNTIYCFSSTSSIALRGKAVSLEYITCKLNSYLFKIILLNSVYFYLLTFNYILFLLSFNTRFLFYFF